MSPDLLATVSEKERKRQEAIFELITSERNYVDSLKMVKRVRERERERKRELKVLLSCDGVCVCVCAGVL